MIIIRVAGGLGNQMQQYAMYRKLRGLKRQVKLDLAWFEEDNQQSVKAKRACELRYFPGLEMDVCTEAERNRFLKRNAVQKAVGTILPSLNPVWEETEMYHPELFTFNDKYLAGYFLCQKYYEGMQDELIRAFAFPMHTEQDAQLRNVDLMNEMEQREAVSIHIRRGDYLDPENAKLFGGIATDTYYDTAIRYFQSRYAHAHFYIFTNDPDYARARFNDAARFTVVDRNTGKNALLDIELMTHCIGNICANSTFSFWGARLNQRAGHEIIRPYKMRNNQTYHAEEMHDYWKDWILMDSDGKIW